MSHKENDKIFDNIMDMEAEHLWKLGKRERLVKKNVAFFTETIPNDLKRLDKVIKAFSKIKLNERGLPF